MDIKLEKLIGDAQNLTDEKILSDLALNGSHWMVRKEAVKNPNLCDASVFEKVLLSEKDDYVCFFAYRRLKHINPDCELFLNPRDVAKITDEDELIRIIKHSIYSSPAVAGGKRVFKCTVYPYLVCPDRRWEVRYHAVSNPHLIDEEILRDVAVNDYDLRVRCAAINNPNLNDEELFCCLALNDCKYSVRCDAARYVRNEDVLMEIVLDDPKSCVRRYAISNPNLHNQSFLTSLAFGDYDYNVRGEAVLKIADEEVIKEIFLNDSHGGVKRTACSCMDDVSFLKHISDGRFKWKLRSESRRRLRKLENFSSHIKEFQKLNTSCDSIYRLGDLDVLIILKDGTNLTSWDDVGCRSDVLYVSEDISGHRDLTGRYNDLSSMKAIVTKGISPKVTSLENMFSGCFSLADISSLMSWDVSNVCSMKGLFMECNSLCDLAPLMDWDVSNVSKMRSMFENCFSLGSIEPLEYWNTSNVVDMAHMFDDCHSLEDISVSCHWDVSGVESMESMFGCCNYLKDISALWSWDISSVRNMAHLFDGCDYLEDFTPLCSWNIDNVENTEGMFSNCGMDVQSIIKSIKEFDMDDGVDLKNAPKPIWQ